MKRYNKKCTESLYQAHTIIKKYFILIYFTLCSYGKPFNNANNQKPNTNGHCSTKNSKINERRQFCSKGTKIKEAEDLSILHGSPKKNNIPFSRTHVKYCFQNSCISIYSTIMSTLYSISMAPQNKRARALTHFFFMHFSFN